MWIKKYLDNSNNGKWKLFLDTTLQNHGGKNILSFNLNVRDTLDLTKVSDDFFKELLEIWGEINFENK